MATDTDTLGEKKKDYVVQTGGNDKQVSHEARCLDP